MKLKKLSEINAGSMADIAFLLLIFFLVTTTMDTDEGIARTLPVKSKEKPLVEVEQNNVLEIQINANDELLVDGELASPGDLYRKAIEFLSNPKKSSELPAHVLVDESYCRKQIASGKTQSDRNALEARWKEELELSQQIGAFDMISKDAVISIKHDNKSSYEMYVQVQDAIQMAIDHLRADASQKYFKRNYYNLKPSEEKDREVIMGLRVIVPQRIVEQEPVNIAVY